MSALPDLEAPAIHIVTVSDRYSLSALKDELNQLHELYDIISIVHNDGYWFIFLRVKS